MQTPDFVTPEELMKLLIAQYRWNISTATTLQAVINILLNKELLTLDVLTEAQNGVLRTRQGQQMHQALAALRQTKTVEEFLREFQGTVQ
jgi:hypothetical protein